MVSDVGLRLVGALAWGAGVEPQVGDPGPPPGAGAIEVPGRRRLPVRTRLDPAAGDGGVVARLVDPGGDARPLAVRLAPADTAVVAVEPAPLAVVPAADGLWTLDADGVAARDAGGSERLRRDLPAVRLVAGPGGGVWALGADRCWWLTTDGDVTEYAAPWRDPSGAAGAGGALAGWDRDRPGGVVLLGPGGESERWDLPDPAGPFERPLRLDRTDALTAALRTLVYRGPGGERALTLAGAGRTAEGDPFLAGTVDGRTVLWRAGRGPQDLALPEGEQVMAVAGDRVLTWSGARAAWWPLDRPDAGPEPAPDGAPVDDGWAVTDPAPFVAGPELAALVAASGPDGAVVLALTWPPLAD